MGWHIFFVLAFLGALVVPSHQYFEDCSPTINLQVGNTQIIKSVGYPDSGFPLNTNCQWKIQAPGEYQVQAVCSIELVGPSPSCPVQRWFVNKDGNPDLNAATYYCGTQTITTVSKGNVLSLAVVASQYSGRYQCTLTPVCDCGWSTTSRIVGGSDAGQTEFTPMAAIYNTNTKNHFCGATIVSSTWVMTAAHCMILYPYANLQVAAGLYNTKAPSNYTQYSYIAQIPTIHPFYVKGYDVNDLALVKIQGRFQWSWAVAPTCLPFYYPSFDFTGSGVWATGWGTTELGGPTSAVLQKVDLTVISNAECNARLTNAMVTPSQICTSGQDKDTCQNDSGGPIWYRSATDNRLFNVGVVSFGEGCGGATPGVNTRTTAFMPWIESFTGPLCRRPM